MSSRHADSNRQFSAGPRRQSAVPRWLLLGGYVVWLLAGVPEGMAAVDDAVSNAAVTSANLEARGDHVLVANGRFVTLLEARSDGPRQRASLYVGEPVSDVAWLDGVSAVAAVAEGLIVVRLNGLDTPAGTSGEATIREVVRWNSCDAPAECLQRLGRIAVQEDILLVSGVFGEPPREAAVGVIDLSQLDSPTLRGVAEVMSSSRWFQPPDGIAVEHDVAFVGVFPGPIQLIEMLDMSDWESPISLGLLSSVGVRDASMRSPTASHGALYAPSLDGGGGILIWSLENPRSPRRVLESPLVGEFVRSLAVSTDGLYALVASSHDWRLIRFGLADPLHPSEDVSLRLPEPATDGNLDAAGRWIWLSSPGRVDLVIDSAANLEHLGSFRLRQGQTFLPAVQQIPLTPGPTTR